MSPASCQEVSGDCQPSRVFPLPPLTIACIWEECALTISVPVHLEIPDMAQSTQMDAPIAPPKRSLLFFFSGGHMANDWAPAAIWLIAPAVALAMGLSPAEVGLLITIHSVGGALAYLPAGLLADRVSNRAVLLAGTFWWVAIGYLIASFAPGFWSLAILLGIAAMGDAAWHPVATGVLTQASPNRRAHVMGLHAVGGTLAEVFAPLSVGFLLFWFDWQQTLQISAIPAILGGVAFFLIRKQVPRSTSTAISKSDLGQLVRIWCSSQGAKMVAMISLYNMAFIGILSMTPLYLQGVHGFSAAETGIIFSGMLLLGALLQPYVGLASDLVGRRTVFLAGNLIAAVCAALIYLMSDPIIIIGLLVIAASSLTGIRSAALAAAVDFVGHRESTTLGMAFALMDGVGALGAAVAGFAAWYDLSYAFVVSACLSSGAVFFMLIMPAPVVAAADR